MDKEIEPKPFKRILVAVDDSPDAQLAFHYAIYRAKADQTELGIVSILETDKFNVYDVLTKEYVLTRRKELDERVLEYTQTAKEMGVEKVSTFVDEGDAAECIVKNVIPVFQPDLLICGSKDKKQNRVKNVFIGSQAAYMAKNSPCSVMVIR